MGKGTGRVDVKKGKHWHRIIFALYLAALCYFLFFAEMFGRTEGGQEYHYNLVLFKEIQRFWRNRQILGFRAVFYNIVGNVIGFMPYGFYLPMLFRRIQDDVSGIFPGIFSVLLFSFLLSLCVETIQLVFKVGSFDVDDLFLNTLGGIAGYMVYILLRKSGKNREGA